MNRQHSAQTFLRHHWGGMEQDFDTCKSGVKLEANLDNYKIKRGSAQKEQEE